MPGCLEWRQIEGLEKSWLMREDLPRVRGMVTDVGTAEEEELFWFDEQGFVLQQLVL